MEKEHRFFELQSAQLYEMGKCTDNKLQTTQTELAMLSGSINLISATFLTSGVAVEDNSRAVFGRVATLRALGLNGGPGGQKQALQQPCLPKRGGLGVERCIVSHTVPTQVALVHPCRAAGDHTGSPNLRWSVLPGIVFALSFSMSLARLFPDL